MISLAPVTCAVFNAFSVLGIPTGDTQITSDLGTGVPKTRGYPIFGPGLFITSPDHLVAWKPQQQNGGCVNSNVLRELCRNYRTCQGFLEVYRTAS